MLAEEFGTASNIKSRVNRLSVLSAITSTQQRLKLYNKVPPNGLVVYCGEIITSEGKERKINIDFEPFKPINTSLYLCDNKFHVEALSELLESDQKCTSFPRRFSPMRASILMTKDLVDFENWYSWFHHYGRQWGFVRNFVRQYSRRDP